MPETYLRNTWDIPWISDTYLIYTKEILVYAWDLFKKCLRQAEAEVVPSSSSVKLESDLVGLRFVEFILD